MTRSAAATAMWRRPGYRARQLAHLQRLAESAEVRERLAAAKRANWADPEYRARQSAAVKRGKAQSHCRVVDLP